MSDPSEPSSVQSDATFEKREFKLQLDKDREELEQKYKLKEEEIVQSRQELKESGDWLRNEHEDEVGELKAKHEKERSELIDTTLGLKNRREKLEEDWGELGRLQHDSSLDEFERNQARMQMDQTHDELKAVEKQIEINNDSLRILHSNHQDERRRLMEKHRIESENMNRYAKEEGKRLDRELRDLQGKHQQDLELLERNYEAIRDQREKHSTNDLESRH